MLSPKKIIYNIPNQIKKNVTAILFVLCALLLYDPIQTGLAVSIAVAIIPMIAEIQVPDVN
jgi:hypothetical protein